MKTRFSEIPPRISSAIHNLTHGPTLVLLVKASTSKFWRSAPISLLLSPKSDNGYSLSSGLGFVRGFWSWSGSGLDDARNERCEVPLIHEKSLDPISLTLDRTGCMMGKQEATTPQLGSASVKY